MVWPGPVMSYSEKKAINIKRHIAPLASQCPTNVCDSKAVKLEFISPERRRWPATMGWVRKVPLARATLETGPRVT